MPDAIIWSPVLARLTRLTGLTGRLSPGCACAEGLISGETLLGVPSIGWVTVIGDTCAEELPSASCTIDGPVNSGALAVGMASGLRFALILACELSASGSSRNVPWRESGLVMPKDASAGGVYPQWNNSRSSESSLRESFRESRELERCGCSPCVRNFDGDSVFIKYESITSRKLLTDGLDWANLPSTAKFNGNAGGGAFSDIDRFLLLKKDDGFLLSARGGREALPEDSLACCKSSFWVFDCLRSPGVVSWPCDGSDADERVEEPPNTRLKNPGRSRCGDGALFRLMLPGADLSPVGVSPLPFVRTNSVAWSLTFCGTVVPLAERRSDCVVVFRRVLCFCAALTYTGPVAEGFCCLRGPAAMFGSGAASVTGSYLLCIEGTGLPRLIIDAVLLFASA